MGLDRIELSSPACFGRRFTQGVAYRKPRTLRLTTPIKLEILVVAALPDSNQHLLHAFTPPPPQG